ncbi:MAG: excinuclease ABC subunit A, partial [Acidobacteria bacterium]|nr:excinuclease ABC subunit A [Acidobacteriota bacterium]
MPRKKQGQEAGGVAIEVRGARTHNLKGVSCNIPHGKVTVVTGPSGAGKSSLAFDTVYAEGQRRFVESMSTYARQFLEKMERPPVDSIDNILPPVALEATNHVKNARSTVGTLSEAHDVLRLLFTHLGEVLCPEGHGPASRWTAGEAAEVLANGEAGSRFLLVVRLARPRRGSKKTLDELIRQGFGRRLEGGKTLRMEPGSPWPKELDPLPLVLGRFQARGESGSQLVAAVEEAFRFGHGSFEVLGDSRTLYVSSHLGCLLCGRRFQRPTPPLFSFNSPLGACQTCQGFGRIIGVDRERVVPDPYRSLEERPIAPWNTPAYEELYDPLFAACRRRGIPLDRPWAELSEVDRRFVWSGPEEGKAGFTTLDAYFRWLERRSYRVHVRVLLARYRAYTPCPDCRGSRFQPATLAVDLMGRTLPQLCALSIEELRLWFERRRWTRAQRNRAGHLLEQIGERLEVLDQVGLGYLTLDR